MNGRIYYHIRCIKVKNTDPGLEVPSNWVWSINNSGIFSIASLRVAFDDCTLAKSHMVVEWSKAVPGKINILAWRAAHRRLPTKINLIKRGLFGPQVSCPLCGEHDEDEDHIFTGCRIAKKSF